MYSLTTAPDQATEYARIGNAIKAAQKFSLETGAEAEVIHTETGVVAFVSTPVPAEQHFTPWTRVETPKFAAPHLEGFRPAYTRKRIEATVYRAINHKGWLVHDGRTGGRLEVKTTKEACELTREMRLGRQL